MKLGSLFDGIGGFPLAASRHGITPVWASEIEPFPIEVTKRHFPDMVHLGDITKINGAEIEPVDIISFGSPCQDLSVAGKRAGMDGERSGLFYEAIRIIKEMRDATDGRWPTFAIWENVPGAISSNEGRDFLAVYTSLIECGAVEIGHRVLDAQFFGVPQRRRRIFLVADFAGHRASEVLFEREGLLGHIAEGGSEGEEVAADIGAGIEGAVKCITPWDCQSKRIFDETGAYPTLQAMSGGGANNTAVLTLTGDVYGIDQQGGKGGANYTVNVAPSILSDSHGTPHAVAHPVTLTGETIARTLTARANSSPCVDRGQVVVFVPQLYENHSQDTRYKGPLDVAQPVTATYGMGGNNQPIDYAVRRLTPTECERLQGFPDGWTAHGSDTARYKALGNSVAVPVVEWIMRRLGEVTQCNT